MLVAPDDAMDADWTDPPLWSTAPITVHEERPRLAWITSPPGLQSGGHQNMFRFIKYAEDAGYRCTVYLYDAQGLGVRERDVSAMIASSDAYANLDGAIQQYDRTRGVDECDAIVATGWETAYASYLDPSLARRFYFVQDFEPSFYPAGTEYVLAENTYRFGFRGLTAGAWLATMLAERYGMASDHYDFGADSALYRVTNQGSRDGVFFYARPVTPRRAFELGVMALERFASERPDATIHLAGEQFARSRVPFAHVSHGSLPLHALNEVYNECAAGLVLSLTNMSLLPLELLAAGVTPVINDGPNNRLVASPDAFAWTPMSVPAIARTVLRAFDEARDGSRAASNSSQTPHTNWDDAGAQFIRALDAHMQR